ncbi:3'-5' RNA helicase YTHDC2-like [Phlebotomus argentipes]|uniref:3'-5' RNA helicase YTHDC2-like n=1 Tax=Phlebotomus argentipes TaxID=94469 RepID=UPI00289371F6|nr:3'-5' RNA helicase YTHDC2-like [Phlebotomus argentipes]
MAPGRKKLPVFVTECFRISFELEVNRFLSSNEMEFSFPSTLTRENRAFIHEYVKTKGLTSKSRGKTQRVLTIYKPKKNASRRQKSVFHIAKRTRSAIYSLLNFCPVTPQEVEELKARNTGTVISRNQFNVGTLTQGYLVVPPAAQDGHVRQIRRQLPIFQKRSAILSQIASSQTIVIVSETGSGKTTQVPQYLLENATELNTPCRIVCTQPRRLAALSVADRVAFERGEQLGDSVGYQIRLESRTSPTSNLIYCTNGILVRCLMGGHYQKVFSNITHVIVDEVHERDKHSDFLLISLKEALAVNPNLRVILMSATIDAQLFSDYFFNCPVIDIPGRLHEVTNYHLEHVLMMTEYCKSEMGTVHSKAVKGPRTCEGGAEEALDEETVKLINESLELCWTQCDEDSFQQFLYFVAGENVPIDFRHTETDMTALMIAAGRGIEEFVEILLQMGANPHIMSQHGMNAIDWARQMGHQSCVGLLEAAALSFTSAVDTGVKINDEYTELLLDVYQKNPRASDEDVDHCLLFTLICMIHAEKPPGSILIFLPGYESIVKQNEMICEAVNAGEIRGNVRIFMLHSNMKVNDQKAVFERMPGDYRKIILSTNIAETSITIDDVVYVVDCGKVKQTTFDALCGTTSLETTWVSQACAQQRAGRAGRVRKGICYRLYSMARYAIMDKFTIPELLRVPLTEICLSAKLIAPQSAIGDYLEKALQPPAAMSVRRSVALLKTMGALNEEETITDLGMHLADLPIDAHLGKMVIFGILMKSLDPILTIVAALSVRDPFVLPTGAYDRARVTVVRENFAEQSFSDHMILIRIYQKWLDTPVNKRRQFCEQNFLSMGAMQTICGVRSQILGHLRATGLIKSKGKGSIHDVNQNARHWAVVKACLVAGLYPSVAVRDVRNAPALRATENQEKVLPHPHSVLGAKRPPDTKLKIKSFPTDWVAFEEKVRVGSSAFTRCNTVITPITVALFAGDIYINEERNLVAVEAPDSDSEQEFDAVGSGSEVIFRVDDNIEFTLMDETAYLIFHLRQKLNHLLLALIQMPDNFHFITNTREGKIIDTIVDVLMTEERQSTFPIPDGIGTRPQAISLDFSAEMNHGIQERSRSSQPIQWNLSDAMRDLRVTTRSSSNRKLPRKGRKNSTKTPSKDIKYYLIKAASTEEVLWVMEGFDWCFSLQIFNYLKQCLKKFPESEIYLIFHVGSAQQFYCMGRFVFRGGKHLVDMVQAGSVNFRTMREMVKRQKAASFNWNDGEELSKEIGELFAQMLSTTDNGK